MADNSDITANVLRERSRLAKFIRKRVRDRTDAEDILQDVLYEFVAAFRLPTPIEQASAWLYQVARHRIIDQFRKRKVQGIGAGSEGAMAGHGAIGEIDGEAGARLDLALPAPDAGPEAEYARAALLRALQEALDELPENQREVFVAHEIEGRSFRDMAEQGGVSVNTLLARKRYAVTFLRSRLRATYDELDF